MSNLQNATRLPLQISMTNKSKSHTLNNELLERKTKALEGGLHKLKITAQRDKTKPSIETTRPNLNKGTSQYANHTSQDKPTVRSFSTKSSTTQQMSKCGQCEKDGAEMKCLECVENYCANCFDHFHTRGALQRHHYVLLSDNSSSTSPKKKPSFSVNNNLTELSNEKPSLALSQQPFLPWRDNDVNKSKRIPQKCELITSIHDTTVDQIESSNKLPNIELNSSKKISNGKILTKTYRIVDKNSQAVYVHRAKRTNTTKQRQSKPNVKINIHHSYPNDTHSHNRKIDIEPLDDDLSKARVTQSVEENSNNDIHFEQERPITHVSTTSNSSPTSSPRKQDSISSRSNSITSFPQPLRSILTTKSNNEYEAIINPQLNLSQSSSYTLEKVDQPSTVLNQNRITSKQNNIAVQSNVIDQYSIARFNLALDDIVDKSKLELAHRFNHLSENVPPIITGKVPLNSVTTISRRNSPFSFSNSLNEPTRIDSSCSRYAGDGGFFTDVLPQQIIPSAVVECSASNEWTHGLEKQSKPNTISSRRSSIEGLSRAASNHSIILDESHHQSKSQIDNHSRRGSSLLSSSISIAVMSSESELDFTNPETEPLATSSRKNSSTAQSSSSSTSSRKSSSVISDNSSTTKKSSSSISKKPSSSKSTLKTVLSPKPTMKNASPSPLIPAAEDEIAALPSDNNEYLQESVNSSKDETPSNVHTSQNLNHLSKPNSMTFTRGETSTVNNTTAKKKTRHRQITTIDDPSKFRKLEFSLGDGLKWQEASVESLSSIKTISSDQSSNVTFPPSPSPSDPINTQFAEDTSIYDNDDDPSSPTYQNITDEDDSNQLRSELDMINSDENVILNDHVLNIRQGAQLSLNDNDVQIFQTQLSDDENVRQPSFDSNLSSYE